MLKFDDRFARQDRCEPPPEFPLASPCSSIVHHLSGLSARALAPPPLASNRRRADVAPAPEAPDHARFAFAAPLGFESPSTRACAQLLGPCFKTGRSECREPRNSTFGVRRRTRAAETRAPESPEEPPARRARDDPRTRLRNGVDAARGPQPQRQPTPRRPTTGTTQCRTSPCRRAFDDAEAGRHASPPPSAPPFAWRLNDDGELAQFRPFASARFHVLLNSLFKVLCNFPSRYLFAIGLALGI